MKKYLKLILIIVSALLLLTACVKKVEIIDMVDEGIEDELIVINSTEKIDTNHLTLLDEYEYDFDNDGVDELIMMYTSAGRDDKGNLMWDDGQDWVFMVSDGDKDFVLFNDRVQLGTLEFFIYTDEDEFDILLLNSSSANLEVTNFKFDLEGNVFIKEDVFKATGNVNLLHKGTI